MNATRVRASSFERTHARDAQRTAFAPDVSSRNNCAGVISCNTDYYFTCKDAARKSLEANRHDHTW